MFKNGLILGRPQVANFPYIIKIAIFLIKITYKESIKVKKIGKIVSKCNFYFYFPKLQKSLVSDGKILGTTEIKGCAALF